MIDALAWQSRQASWLKEGGVFVPYPATWIRQGRYDDEPIGTPTPTRKIAQEAVDDFMVAAGHWTVGCKRLHGGACQTANEHYALIESGQASA